MLKHSGTGKEEEGEQGGVRYRRFRLCGNGDAAVCDALDEVLQSFRQSVEAVVSLTEMSMSSGLHISSSCLNTPIFNSPTGDGITLL
jgi:hypothetical protein